MRKKVLGILIALVMVLSLLPAGAMAAEPKNQVVTSQENTALYYDADGKAVDATSLGANGSVVELKKWVEGTNVENEFVVNLQVRTTTDIRELKSDTPDAAAMLILDVSNSMDDCDACGQEQNSKNHGNKNGQHTYVSRLAKAKAAAIQFLDDFATKTGAETGDKRYVAIVDFGSMAATRQTWVDVTNAAQLAAAKAVINSLTVAHSGTTYSDDGGTNIEAALMLGANLWNSNATVKAIDYKYTILLTDGNPTFHVTDNEKTRNSTTAVYGTIGGGNETEYADAKDVGVQAKRILDLGSLSKLYSICYGSVTNGNTTTKVWDAKPFDDWNQASPATTKSMTVGQWLEAFSTKAYDGAASGLFDSFNSIVSQIQLAAQAWKVNDIMGPYAVYGGEIAQSHNNKSSFANGELEWDVLASNTFKVETNGDNAVLTYNFKYKVTLDNLNSAYTAETATLTNEKAELQYAVLNSETGLWSVLDPVAFPQPTVKGLKGDLTFRKFYENAEGQLVPIEGMQFQLVPVNASSTGTTWASGVVTSDENGMVTFSNIPSGQDYYLRETNTDEFVALGDLNVSVDWETAACAALTAGSDGVLQLENKPTVKWVNLTLTKDFGSTVHPDSIRFTITNESINYHNEVTLSAANNWTVTLKGLQPGTYVVYEDAAMDGYNVNIEATQTSNDQSTSLDTSYGNVHVVMPEPPLQSQYTEHTVTFTNTYTQKVGALSLEKSFWVRNHDELISGSDETTVEKMDSDLYANAEVTITLTDAKGTIHTVKLNKGNDWKANLTKLPIGEYTITETTAVNIPDHDFVHLHLNVNGAEREDNKVTVGENTTIAVVMENHYTHQMGDIRVTKDLAAADDNTNLDELLDAIPEDKVFLIDVYEATNSTTATSNLVTTIEVEKLVNGELVGQSIDLPVGWYYLVERENSTAVDGYNFKGGVFSSQFIQIVKGGETSTANVILTNTYKKQMGSLTVSKVFDIPEEYEEEINLTEIHVLVLDTNSVPVTTLKLKKDQNWTARVDLPLGTYYLSEVIAEDAEGTADVPNFGLAENWDNATVTITTDGQQVTRTVTNVYTKDFGKLTLNKSFENLTDELKDKLNLTFIIYDAETKQQAAVTTLPETASNGSKVWTKTIDLPVGTYYLVERGAQNALNDYHYTFTGLEINDAVVDLVNGYEFTISSQNDEPVTTTLNAVNTYEKDTGSLTINKKFATDDDLEDAYFANKSIDVQIMRDGSVLQTVTLNNGNGWSVTVPGLEAGVTYTLVEVHTEDAANTAFVQDYDLTYSWSNGAEVLLTKNGASNTVTNSYKRQTGTLVVRKFFEGVSDEDRAALNKLSIVVDVIKNAGTNAEEVVKQITLNNSNSWYSGIITLPVGEYVLEEASINLEGYEHTGVEFVSALHPGQVTDGNNADKKANVTVKHGANNEVRVQLTNTMRRKTGELVIEKTFAGDFTAATFPNGKIDVLVKHNGSLYQKVTLKASTDPATNWKATLTNVPAGTYQVEEVIGVNETNTAHVKDHGLHVTYTNHGTVQVPDKGTANMTVTNEYTQHVGSLTVTKTFAKDEADRTETLEAEKQIGKIAIRVKDEDGNVVATGYVSRTLGATVTFNELPVGTYYVEEVTDPNAADTAFVDGYHLVSKWNGQVVANAEVKIEENQTASAAVDNTYTRDKGYIKVTKNVVGLTDAEKENKSFTVYIRQNGVTVDTLTLAAPNWTATSKALPTGSYMVVEDETAANINNYSLKVTYDATILTVDEAGKTVDTTITNSYTRKDLKHIDFAFEKLVSFDEVVPEATTFNFKLTTDFASLNALLRSAPTQLPDNAVEVWYAGSKVEQETDGSYKLALTVPAGQKSATGKVTVYANQDEINNLVVRISEIAGTDDKWTYDDANHTITVRNGKVVVPEGGVKFTNDYKLKKTPRLSITKKLLGFESNASDAPKELVFEIAGGELTAPRKITLTPDEQGNWKTEISDLKPGTYTVTEMNPDLPYYDVATTVSGNITAVPGTTRAAKVTLAYDEIATVNFTNTYTRSTADMITLNITKEIKSVGKVPVSKEETFNFAVNFSWKPNDGLMLMSNGIVDPKTVQVQVEGTEGWKTVNVPGAFEFSVTTKETVTAKLNIKVNPDDLEKLKITVNEVGGNASFWSYDTAAKEVTLTDKVGSVTITNTYDENLTSLTIPVTKTVVQGGNIATGVNTFYFEAADWGDTDPSLVTINVNAASGSEGKVVDLGNGKFSITVNGAGNEAANVVVYYPQSAKIGPILIRELAGSGDKLTSEELAASGWTYDPSAFKTVKDGKTWISPWIVDGKTIHNPAGEKVSEVNITNTYTANTPPPQTGDDSNIALWMTLMGVSAAGVALISKRRKTC